MAFIQIVEFRTSKINEMRKLEDKSSERAGTDTSARRTLLRADRDDPRHYFTVAFFDSYESAMQNSEHPLTRTNRRRTSPRRGFARGT
jgi:hypothetical protein